MISHNEIYSNTIKHYVDHFQSTETKFSIIGKLDKTQEETLPSEAFNKQNLLVANFDNWTLQQVFIDDKHIFNCVLVYNDANGTPTEYDISLPVFNILFITNPKLDIVAQPTDSNPVNPINTVQQQRSIDSFKQISGIDIPKDIS